MTRTSKEWNPSVEFDDQEKSSLTTKISNSMTNEYTWDEIQRRSKKTDRWIVIDNQVYDVTRWIKHPGGQMLLNHYAGQDATV